MNTMRAAVATGAMVTAMLMGTVSAQAATDNFAAPSVSGRATLASSGQDYARGYREGYSTGFYDARNTCQAISHGSHYRSRQSDYERGFSAGYDKGFGRGVGQFCQHRY